MENRILGALVFVLPIFFLWCEFHFASFGSRNIVETFLKMDVNSVWTMTIGVVCGCLSYNISGWVTK